MDIVSSKWDTLKSLFLFGSHKQPSRQSITNDIWSSKSSVIKPIFHWWGNSITELVGSKDRGDVPRIIARCLPCTVGSRSHIHTFFLPDSLIPRGNMQSKTGCSYTDSASIKLAKKVVADQSPQNVCLAFHTTSRLPRYSIAEPKSHSDLLSG